MSNKMNEGSPDLTRQKEILAKFGDEQQGKIATTFGLVESQMQNYEDAVAWWQIGADLGEPEAQYQLGMAYFDGKGIEHSFKTAFYWLKKAAENGLVLAQSDVAVCYHIGLGVEKNNKKAVEWLEKAAEQGDASAKYLLGECYKDGIGVEQDNVKAAEWQQKALDQGGNEKELKLSASCWEVSEVFCFLKDI